MVEPSLPGGFFIACYLFWNKEANPIKTMQNVSNSIHVIIGIIERSPCTRFCKYRGFIVYMPAYLFLSRDNASLSTSCITMRNSTRPGNIISTMITTATLFPNILFKAINAESGTDTDTRTFAETL